MLKIKLDVLEGKVESILKQLQNQEFLICEQADYILVEINKKNRLIFGKNELEQRLIGFDEIVFIESFGHEIVLHTKNSTYKIKEKISALENTLPQTEFIKVNISQIIRRKAIKKINPSFSMKFRLEMVNGSKLFVTRTYYLKFKEFIGF